MEKYGCKFSELKDPQERQSVGGTIGGRMRQVGGRSQGLPGWFGGGALKVEGGRNRGLC